MPLIPEPPPSTDFLLGQITAQLKEMVHSQNGTSQVILGMERSLEKQISELAIEVRGRLTILETANARREGATGILAIILKSPAIGWLVGAASVVYLYIAGKLGHP